MSEVSQGAKLGGRFDVTCWRKIPKRHWHQEQMWYLVWEEHTHNVMTIEGLNHILDVTVHNKTLINPFYCVLFESDTTPVEADDYAAPQYTETEAYDEGTRPEYEEAAASGKSITNSANKATFTISATKTMYGAALVGGSSTKSDTTNAAVDVLLCSSPFGASRAVIDNDVVNLT